MILLLEIQRIFLPKLIQIFGAWLLLVIVDLHLLHHQRHNSIRLLLLRAVCLLIRLLEEAREVVGVGTGLLRQALAGFELGDEGGDHAQCHSSFHLAEDSRKEIMKNFSTLSRSVSDSVLSISQAQHPLRLIMSHHHFQRHRDHRVVVTGEGFEFLN